MCIRDSNMDVRLQFFCDVRQFNAGHAVHADVGNEQVNGFALQVFQGGFTADHGVNHFKLRRKLLNDACLLYTSRQVLLEDGVPDSAILREDQATFTWDNARKSRQVTDAAGLDIRRAILCCKGCHARRALLYYQAAFPGTRFLVCPARCPGLNPEDWFLTPLGRETVLGEVQRLGGQMCIRDRCRAWPAAAKPPSPCTALPGCSMPIGRPCGPSS